MDTNLKPKVTVLMAVYNGEQFLGQAIESILAQTFSDFEFLVIDDGSTDKSASIIQSFKDKRILYIPNKVNMGLSYSLNRGLDMARGEFVARMDADDISLPERLQKQIDFMTKNPNVAVCGTFVKTFGGNRKELVHRHFTDPEDIKASLLFNTSLTHPSTMIRLSVLNDNHLRYDAHDLHFEDYALWIKIIKYGKLANIPEVLFLYRLHSGSVSSANTSSQKQGSSIVKKEQLEKLGLYPNEEEMRIRDSLYPKKNEKENESVAEFLDKEEIWLSKIITANTEKKIYRSQSLSKIIYTRWYLICSANTKEGVVVWQKFINSKLSLESGSHLFASVKLLIKSLL